MSIASISPNFGPVVQSEFLSLYPTILQHARFVFRARNPCDREEAEAEAIAAAFESFVRLKARGKEPARDFPSLMATYAVLHVKDGRHVGGSSSSTDALSPKAQSIHGFRIESLCLLLPSSAVSPFSQFGSQRTRDEMEECLGEHRRTPVPEQVCFRLDFPAFLRTLSARDRRLARFLSLGNSAKDASVRFKLSPARITQLRKHWQKEWKTFQEEDAVPRCIR
jgi:hypothetical protein